MRAYVLRNENKEDCSGRDEHVGVTEIDGTGGSIAFSTKLPKTVRFMEYRPGGPQAWQTLDLGSESAYPTITGAIFEFGFSDAILQKWAAFLDELAHGRERMRQPFYCATPDGGASAIHSRSELARRARGGLGYRFFPGFVRRLTRAPLSEIVTRSMTTMSSRR